MGTRKAGALQATEHNPKFKCKGLHLQDILMGEVITMHGSFSEEIALIGSTLPTPMSLSKKNQSGVVRDKKSPHTSLADCQNGGRACFLVAYLTQGNWSGRHKTFAPCGSPKNPSLKIS